MIKAILADLKTITATLAADAAKGHYNVGDTNTAVELCLKDGIWQLGRKSVPCEGFVYEVNDQPAGISFVGMWIRQRRISH